MSDRILVMYAGKIIKSGSRDEILRQPLHPYTEMLPKAAPKVSRRGSGRLREVSSGEPLALLNLPSGCVFHPRCPYAKLVCQEEVPVLRDVDSQHHVSCHLAEELTLQSVFD